MPESPPTSLPPGSWGGDADPQTADQRARFEMDLQRQTEARQAALAGQQPVVGQPMLGPPPAPKPPIPGGLYIPPDLGLGGDLISAMGEEELRTSNAHRQEQGLAVERQPVAVREPEPTAVIAPQNIPVAAPSSNVPGSPPDLAWLLAEVARVCQRGTLPLMRHLRDRIADGQLTPAELGEALEAASQIVTAAVQNMSRK